MSQSIPLTESTRSKADRPWRVAVIAGSILLVELAFIRLIPAEVRAISYFRNLILMAAFMGLGVGCILQDSRSIELLLPIGLVTLASLMLIGRGIVIYPQSSEVHYWLIYGEMHERPQLPLSLAAGLLFVSCSIPFAALGQSLAREMSRHERLPAYGWDLAGSLAGVLIFVLASALRLPPWIWPCIVMAVWSLFFVRTALWRLFYASAGLIFLCFSFSHQQSLWSPYYLVQYERTPVGTRVFVNSGFHQFGFDFSAQSKDWSPILDEIVKKWTVPYDAYRAENRLTRHLRRSPRRFRFRNRPASWHLLAPDQCIEPGDRRWNRKRWVSANGCVGKPVGESRVCRVGAPAAEPAADPAAEPADSPRRTPLDEAPWTIRWIAMHQDTTIEAVVWDAERHLPPGWRRLEPSEALQREDHAWGLVAATGSAGWIPVNPKGIGRKAGEDFLIRKRLAGSQEAG